MMYQDNKNFIEIGPWVRGVSYLEQQDLDEAKNFIKPNNLHVQKRTFLKLPRVTHTQRHPHQKTILKMSRKSLDLTDSPKQPISARYGVMNGSLRKGRQQNTGLSIHLEKEQRTTINVALERKVSTVQMGDPIIEQQLPSKNRRRLVNQQHAKKRGLMQFIRQVTVNKDCMRFYMENRLDPTPLYNH